MTFHRLAKYALAVALFSGASYSFDGYDPRDYTTGPFKNCKPEGKGGDPDLNLLKNRDLPPESYQAYDMHDIWNLPEDLPASKRVNWTQAQRDAAIKYERLGVSVEGYLLGVREEGTEACNCGRSYLRDFHLWLAEKAGDAHAKSVVVEISPRLRDNHPRWNRKELKRLVKDKVRVRISGWLLWDQKHGTSTSRGTSWEIHPIHQIEVWQNGEWKNFK